MFFMIICVCASASVSVRNPAVNSLLRVPPFRNFNIAKLKCCQAYKQCLSHPHNLCQRVPQQDSIANAVCVGVCVCSSNNNTMHWANWRRGSIFW